MNEAIKAKASATLKWRETNYLLLRRGPYTIAAGLDESVAGEPKTLSGRFVNLFDPELRVQNSFAITPGSRYFLLDLNATPRRDATVLASACKALVLKKAENSFSLTVEGVANTSAILLISTHNENPKSVTLDGKPLTTFQYSPQDNLLWLRFENESHPRELKLGF